MTRLILGVKSISAAHTCKVFGYQQRIVSRPAMYLHSFPLSPYGNNNKLLKMTNFKHELAHKILVLL